MKIKDIFWYGIVVPIMILGYIILITPFLIILTLLDKIDERKMVNIYEYIEERSKK